MAWTKTTDGRMSCSDCGAVFDVGRACSCAASSSPRPLQVQDSQPKPGAEGEDFSTPPKRKRGGQVLPEVLSTRDVAVATAEVARRARATYTRIADIDLDAPPRFEGGPPPGQLELQMRRTQLLALETRLKALRLAGAQAEVRESDERLDKLERAVAAIRRGDVKREEAVH
jgi:hypothetical protein